MHVRNARLNGASVHSEPGLAARRAQAWIRYLKIQTAPRQKLPSNYNSLRQRRLESAPWGP